MFAKILLLLATAAATLLSMATSVPQHRFVEVPFDDRPAPQQTQFSSSQPAQGAFQPEQFSSVTRPTPTFRADTTGHHPTFNTNNNVRPVGGRTQAFRSQPASQLQSFDQGVFPERSHFQTAHFDQQIITSRPEQSQPQFAHFVDPSGLEPLPTAPPARLTSFVHKSAAPHRFRIAKVEAPSRRQPSEQSFDLHGRFSDVDSAPRTHTFVGAEDPIVRQPPARETAFVRPAARAPFDRRHPEVSQQQVSRLQQRFPEQPEFLIDVQPDREMASQVFSNARRGEVRRPGQTEAEAQEALFRQQAENAQYRFSSQVDDTINGNQHQREEVRDGLAVKGMYTYSDGYVKRTVFYEADEKGYRIVKQDEEPLGNGPEIDPNGHADVSSFISGNALQYSITNADIQQNKNRGLLPDKRIQS